MDNGNTLPISIPLPIANVGIQNLIQNHQTNKNSEKSMQYSAVPIINIQIPNNIGCSLPPPAHSNAEILDLTVKSKNSVNISSTESLRVTKTTNESTSFCIENEEEKCLPLDLSTKSTENVCLPDVEDSQDDDFIRRLIETSEFDYNSENLKKGCNSTILSYDTEKSFKAALDMPLLEIDETDLTDLIKHSTALPNHNNSEQNNATRKPKLSLINNEYNISYSLFFFLLL